MWWPGSTLKNKIKLLASDAALNGNGEVDGKLRTLRVYNDLRTRPKKITRKWSSWELYLEALD